MTVSETEKRPRVFSLTPEGSELSSEVVIKLGRYAFPLDPPRLLVQLVDPYTQNIHTTLSINCPTESGLDAGLFYAKVGEEEVLLQLEDMGAVKVTEREVRANDMVISKVVRLVISRDLCVVAPEDDVDAQKELAELVQSELEKLKLMRSRSDVTASVTSSVTASVTAVDIA